MSEIRNTVQQTSSNLTGSTGMSMPMLIAIAAAVVTVIIGIFSQGLGLLILSLGLLAAVIMDFVQTEQS